MSDVSPTVLFEHPLNEKCARLRIEFLLQQLHGQRALSETAIALTFFRTVSDLLDVLERGEVRTELLKELERQQQKLLARADVPGVDMALIDQLRGQLKSRSSALMAAPRLGGAARRSADRHGAPAAEHSRRLLQLRSANPAHVDARAAAGSRCRRRHGCSRWIR